MVDRRSPGRGRASRVNSEILTQLARAAVKGSNDDRDRFVEACWHYAYDAARRAGRKHHGAEDSAQDAAMAVSNLLERNALKPETVGGLIGTLVLRNAYAAARQRLREATIEDQAVPAREAPDTAVAVETAEWAQRVIDAVDALPEPLRRLVALRHWDGRSLDEIARLLGTSRRTISRQLRDAEAALRHALRGLGGPDVGPPPCSAADR